MPFPRQPWVRGGGGARVRRGVDSLRGRGGAGPGWAEGAVDPREVRQWGERAEGERWVGTLLR